MMNAECNTLLKEFTQNYADFIIDSPTAFHAQHILAHHLCEAGFSAQNEAAPWQGAYKGFIARAGAVIAWQLPDRINSSTGFRIVGSHLDSPSFKIKPIPDSTAHGFHQVNVEVYGGPLLNSWLNRDLGLAGIITTIDGEEILVKTPAIMTIPQLAPHLDRSANTKLELSAQIDYHPIWSLCSIGACYEGECAGEDEGNNTSEDGASSKHTCARNSSSTADIFEYLAHSAGIRTDRVAGMDIFAYDTQAPAVFGGEDGAEFFASGRQDNLSSAFAAFEAFLAHAKGEYRIQPDGTDVCSCDGVTCTCAVDGADAGSTGIANNHIDGTGAENADGENANILIYAAFNNEEVGSRTITGANSALLEHVLERIALYAASNVCGSALADWAPQHDSEHVNSRELYLRMLANSVIISADAGHSINPNKPQMHDSTHHPVLGRGPLLKFNADERYSTSAQGAPYWFRACALAGAGSQDFVSNNDVSCGSTIGPFIASRLSVVTIDVGVPLLSMHSVREISSPHDVFDLSLILEGFYAGA